MGSVVYALSLQSDPTNYRYIGRTSKSLRRRLSAHKSAAKKGSKTYVYRWIRKSLAIGETILITPLEENLTYEESGFREIFYIKEFRELGYNLTNLTDGGDGALGSVHTHSLETRAKLSIASKGNTSALGSIRTLEQKAKMSAVNVGNTNALGNPSRLGHTNSSEHNAKISVARKKYEMLKNEQSGRVKI